MGESAAIASVSGFIGAVGDVFTEAMTWLASVGQAIISDGVLLTFVAVSLVGLGVGLYRRLLNIG